MLNLKPKASGLRGIWGCCPALSSMCARTHLTSGWCGCLLAQWSSLLILGNVREEQVGNSSRYQACDKAAATELPPSDSREAAQNCKNHARERGHVYHSK